MGNSTSKLTKKQKKIIKLYEEYEEASSEAGDWEQKMWNAADELESLGVRLDENLPEWLLENETEKLEKTTYPQNIESETSARSDNSSPSPCSELDMRIDELLASIHLTYDCVFEHGQNGLSSIDNLRRIANDVKNAAQNLKKLVGEAWGSDRTSCPVCGAYLITSFHKPDCKLGIILGEQ